MSEETKKSIEEAKKELSNLPGGIPAILIGFAIGAMVVLSCFFNIWVGIIGVGIITALAVMNFSGVAMKPENVVVIAGALISIPITLVVLLAVLCAIHIIQALILLII